MRKRLRCRFGIHDWHKMSSEDGSSHYLPCRRCGKYADVPERGHWAAPAA